MTEQDQVQEALKLLHERLPYVVQKCTDGLLWETICQVVGKTAAYDEMTDRKIADLESKWRYLPKNEADRLAEGINIGKKIAARQAHKQNRSRTYSPDRP